MFMIIILTISSLQPLQGPALSSAGRWGGGGGGGGGGLLTAGDILTGVKRSTDSLKLGLEKSETPQ